MSKLKCLCGNVLSSVISPSPIEHRLISDVDADEINDGRNPYDHLMDCGISVWKCPECDRMAVFDLPNDACVPTWYKKEEVSHE